MFDSQSCPELSEGGNLLHDYRADGRLLSISTEEQEAEDLYYGLCSASRPEHAIQILAQALTRQPRDAGAYLAWLVDRRPQYSPKLGVE